MNKVQSIKNGYEEEDRVLSDLLDHCVLDQSPLSVVQNAGHLHNLFNIISPHFFPILYLLFTRRRV
jgi:hypothetical protein